MQKRRASEQYQHEIAAVLAGIEGVENISDDIIIHAPDKESHDERLHAVLRRLENCDLTLNAEKCQFNMDKLVFMGMLLSEKGIGPTAERVRAVVEAREPENASEVRSFLGLAGYISEPLRRLTEGRMPNFILGLSKRKLSKFSKISWLKPQHWHISTRMLQRKSLLMLDQRASEQY